MDQRLRGAARAGQFFKIAERVAGVEAESSERSPQPSAAHLLIRDDPVRPSSLLKNGRARLPPSHECWKTRLGGSLTLPENRFSTCC